MHKTLAYLTSSVFLLSFAVQQALGDLVAYYPLDEGVGTFVRDFSGYGHDGQAAVEPNWIDSAPGFGKAVYYDGSQPAPAWINCGTWNPSEVTGELGVTCWVKWGGVNGEWSGIVAKRDGWDPDQNGVPPTMWYLEVSTNGDLKFSRRGDEILDVQFGLALPVEEWSHVAVSFDGTDVSLYVDGEEKNTEPFSFGPAVNATVMIGADNLGGANGFFGAIDEVRLYDAALSQEDIESIMFDVGIPPEVARGPKPKNQQIDVARDSLLGWRSGLYAVQHDLYFGTDFNDVNEASIDDPRGVLIEQGMTDARYDPGPLEFTQTYYWRVDEVNDQDPNSPWKGTVWSFTVANYLLIDDFEGYNDTNNKIFNTWLDFYVNNTGMTVGYLEEPTVEKEIVYAGKQAMPLSYDNDGTVNEGTSNETTGTLFYSEAVYQWTEPQDWTKDGIESLSLWFKGHLAASGRFIEEPAGTFQLTGLGSDIWSSYDEFHFAYKEVSGSANIIARVDTLDNTDPFAKAGVMIRDSLEPGAKNCALLITPENGVRFQYRTGQDDVTDRQFDPNVAVPYWVRLERTSGGLVRAYYSSDGSDWLRFNLQAVIMTNPIYIGLAVTSHNEAVPCEATFSNVSFPSTSVDPTWTAQDIGVLSNEAEPLYVVVNAHHPVYHNDANASLTGQWTEWQIPLQAFTDLGVDLGSVTSLGIGLGDRDNPQLGGQGQLYIDNVLLLRPPID